MEFRDLKTQYSILKEKIDKAMIKVATDCNFIMGNQVKELEAALSEYVGVKHCITCANGTDALTMSLMAWGIGKGDAVFVPDFTFFSSGETAAFVHAVPIFVDVDKDTFNISPEKLEASIKKVLQEGKLKPKVIVAVDLFGLPADYESIKVIAEKYNLLILEDGAQGFGGSIGGKKACSFGDISTTSFFPAKPLGCYGDGGAIFTDNDEIAELLRSIKIHGKGKCKYDNIRIGLNSRLDTIQAAILQVKLEAFKEYELQDVNEAAELYTEKLKQIVEVPFVPDNFYSSWAQYTIKLESKEIRDELQKRLKLYNIPSMVYYEKPMHMQKAFDDVDFDENSYINTNKLCECVLSLPIHPYIKIEDIENVCEIIADYLK